MTMVMARAAVSPATAPAAMRRIRLDVKVLIPSLHGSEPRGLPAGSISLRTLPSAGDAVMTGRAGRRRPERDYPAQSVRARSAMSAWRRA